MKPRFMIVVFLVLALAVPGSTLAQQNSKAGAQTQNKQVASSAANQPNHALLVAAEQEKPQVIMTLRELVAMETMRTKKTALQVPTL